MQLREWNARLHGLVVFRALLGDPVVAKLAALTDRLEAADDSIAPLCDAVAAFEAALFAHTTNLGDYLFQRRAGDRDRLCTTGCCGPALPCDGGRPEQ